MQKQQRQPKPTPSHQVAAAATATPLAAAAAAAAATAAAANLVRSLPAATNPTPRSCDHLQVLQPQNEARMKWHANWLQGLRNANPKP